MGILFQYGDEGRSSKKIGTNFSLPLNFICGDDCAILNRILFVDGPPPYCDILSF